MNNKVSIKSPCTEDWNKMTGSNSIRNCSKCQFNVYNFSEMEQSEIDAILTSGSRVCARLYIRPDGTYQTKDCKTKVKRKRFHKLIQWAAILPFSFLLPSCSDTHLENHNPEVNGPETDRPIKMGKIANPNNQPQIMGEICVEPDEETNKKQ